MRVAVRKRMGARMKMRTRAVKRAWWTRTRMQRRRVKWSSVCSHEHGGALVGISGNELCFWEGRVHQNTPTMFALRGLEEPQGCCSAFWGVLAPQQCGSPSAPLPSPCAVTQWGHGNDAPHVSQPDFLLCLQL